MCLAQGTGSVCCIPRTVGCVEVLGVGCKKWVQGRAKGHDCRAQGLGCRIRAAGTLRHFLLLPAVPCRTCAELPLPFLGAAMTSESTPITRREDEMLPAWSETRVVDSAVFRLCHWLPHPLNIHIFVHFESKRKAER